MRAWSCFPHDMAKARASFYCTDCGNESLKWQGRCPSCGAWNTIVEQPAADVKKKAAASRSVGLGIRRPTPMAEVEAVDELRFNTGRRCGEGFAGAGGRRAGHWKVHPDAADL